MAAFTQGAGIIGLPENTKEGGRRVDFGVLNAQGDTQFDFLVETKCPRYAWSRRAACPCRSSNPQAVDRSDPDCDLCDGRGNLYFAPADYVVDPSKVGQLDPLQEALVARSRAAVIKVLVTSAKSSPSLFAALGEFAVGSARGTFRAKNKVSYYDRLIALDETIAFSEVVTVASSGNALTTKYPVVSVNLLRGLTATYDDDDVEINDDGTLVWRTGRAPVAGTRLALHYYARPVWIALEHLHVSRTTLVKQKKGATTTPQGDIVDLPTEVLLRLAHLFDVPEST